MFSKEESKKIREEFWTGFGKQSSRKWILYDTRIKELQLKFSFNNKEAKVSIDVSSKDEIIRSYYFEKLTSLKSILLNEYLPEAVFEENLVLPEGKIISSVYVILKGVNINSKKDWPVVASFFQENMDLFERFFREYEDYIRD